MPLVSAIRTVFTVIRAASPKRLNLVLACQVAGAVGVAAQLLALRSLVAHVGVGRSEGLGSQAVLATVAFCGATLVTTGAGALAQELRLLITEDLRRGMTMRLLKVAGGADYAQFDQPNFHNDLRAAQDTVDQRLHSFPWAVLRIGSAVLDSIAVAVVIARVEPLILVLAATVGLPLIAATSYKSKVLFGFYYGETSTDRRRTYLTSMMLDRNRLPELYVHQTRSELLRRVEAMFDLRALNARGVFSKRLPAVAISNTASVTGLFVAVGATVWLASIGRISIEEAAVAAVAVNHLRGKSTSLSVGIEEVQQSAPFIELIDRLEQQVSSQNSTVQPPVGNIDLTTPRAIEPFQELNFDNVTFHYPGADRPALDGVSFTLKAGQVVALVGTNGSGKTTLTKLAAGLYKPTRGTVEWNGQEVGQVHAGRPQAIAQLFQDFNRYELSALDNITLVRDHNAQPEQSDVQQAARAAGAHQWLQALPDGYDTILSRSLDHGVELSGGQWQRLALARTIYRDSELVILDEPTAAQDPKAEADFMNRIRQAVNGKTVLLVSHRFSTVRWADAIGVMEAGQLIEWGTHNHLMNLKGAYHAMFTAQAEPYLDDATT